MTVEATAQALAVEPVVDAAETPEVSEDEALEAIWNKDEAQVETTDEQDAEEVEAEQVEEESEEAEEPEQVEAAAPTDIPKAVKDHWNDIPEAARTAMVDSQREMSRKLAEQGRLVQGISPIRDVLSDAIKENPSLSNMRPEDLARDVMELSRISAQFNEKPVETIMGLVKQHGMEEQFRQLMTGQQPTEAATANTELRQEITALKKQLQQVTNPDYIQSQAQQVLTQSQVQSDVSNFASTAEHWNAVEAEMPQYIQAVKAISPNASPSDVLKDAYDLAVSRLVPEASKATQPASVEEPAAVDPKKTEAALKAKSVNVRSKPTDKSRKLTEDEELSKVWERNVS